VTCRLFDPEWIEFGKLPCALDGLNDPFLISVQHELVGSTDLFANNVGLIAVDLPGLAPEKVGEKMYAQHRPAREPQVPPHHPSTGCAARTTQQPRAATGAASQCQP